MTPDTDPRLLARLLGEPRGTRDDEAQVLAALLEPFGFRLHRNLEIQWFDLPVVALREPGVPPAIARMVAAQPDCIFEDAFFVRQVARATRTIPIVTVLRDPVADGLARSIARPGGNVTGLYGGGDTIEVKSLDFLRRAMPGLACVGWIGENVLLHQFAAFEATARQAQLDARKIVVEPRAKDWQAKLAAQFASLRAAGCTGAMLFVPSPATLDEVAKLALRHGIAIAILDNKDEDIERDGLLLRFAGADGLEVTKRRVAAIVARVLRGERPADMPFEGPSRFELVVNRRTARRIGVTIPPDMLILAERILD